MRRPEWPSIRKDGRNLSSFGIASKMQRCTQITILHCSIQQNFLICPVLNLPPPSIHPIKSVPLQSDDSYNAFSKTSAHCSSTVSLFLSLFHKISEFSQFTKCVPPVRLHLPDAPQKLTESLNRLLVLHAKTFEMI